MISYTETGVMFYIYYQRYDIHYKNMHVCIMISYDVTGSVTGVNGSSPIKHGATHVIVLVY